MTTPDIAVKQPKTGERFRLPDPPERELDERMTTIDHLHEPGNTHHLSQHLGNPASTLVTGERYVTMMPERRLPSGRYRRVPDLLIAFGVNPQAYYASNGYIIQEQGKPPDFVLEVASKSTGDEDTGPKRRDYEALGVTEYWRFDETGEYHKTRLAGDRLVNGRYEPIAIEELPRRRPARVQRGAEHPPALGTGPAGLARPGHGAAHRHVRERAGPGRPGGGASQRGIRGQAPGGGPHPGTGRGEPAASRRVNVRQAITEPTAKISFLRCRSCHEERCEERCNPRKGPPCPRQQRGLLNRPLLPPALTDAKGPIGRRPLAWELLDRQAVREGEPGAAKSESEMEETTSTMVISHTRDTAESRPKLLGNRTLSKAVSELPQPSVPTLSRSYVPGLRLCCAGTRACESDGWRRRNRKIPRRTTRLYGENNKCVYNTAS